RRAVAGAGAGRPQALALPFGALPALPGKPASARSRWIAATPLAASLLLAYSVLRLTADPAAAHGTILDAIRARGPSGGWRGNLAAFGCHWLAAVPLALPWLWARARRLVRDAGTWLLFAAAWPLLIRGAGPKMSVPLAAATALAFVVLADVLRDAWRRGDRIQGTLGAWLLPSLLALFYVQLPCKLLLVSVPAAALLTAGLLDRADARLPLGAGAAVVACGAALGALIALADSEFTDAGRRAAQLYVAPMVRTGQR